MTDPKQLTIDLGGKWYRSYGAAPCPVCQPERRRDQTGLTIGAGGDRLLLHCKKSGCDFRDILAAAAISADHFEPDPEALRQMEAEREAQAQQKLARARSIWEHAQPIHGTHGEHYLRARGITCALPGSLRWLPDTYHGPSGSYCGAMVANVSSGGVHRTFFDKKGARLTKSAKMMFGPCSGGAVHLSEGPGPLVVCEGIETGLTLLCNLVRGPSTVWAALSTSGMRALNLPAETHDLIVAPDGDDPGRAAASALATRAAALGWKVSLMHAPEGQDFNDVLMIGVAA
ncbi:MAG: toprim domain-containing protein [Pseudomonadota bacterium]